jgi:hypothetical protein
MKALEKAKLVIIDEWDYLPMDREQAHLLFKVIAALERPPFSPLACGVYIISQY